jgi:WD40 repeat protein
MNSLILVLPLLGLRGCLCGESPPPTLFRELPMELPSFSGPAFSPDGRTVAVSAGDTVTLWEVASGKVRARLKSPLITSPPVIFTHNGRSVLTVTCFTAKVSALLMWDLTTGKVRRRLMAEGGLNREIVLSPTGAILASGEAHGAVKLWDMSAGKTLVTLDSGKKLGSVTALALPADGNSVAVGCSTTSPSSGPEVQVWDLATGRKRHTLQVYFRGMLRYIAYSPDGKSLVAGSPEDAIRIWEADTGRLKANWRVQIDLVHTAAFSPDGNLLAVAGEVGDRETLEIVGEAWLLDARSGQVLHKIRAPGPIRQVTFSPDGRTLGVGGKMEAVFLWDISPLRAR